MLEIKCTPFLYSFTSTNPKLNQVSFTSRKDDERSATNKIYTEEV